MSTILFVSYTSSNQENYSEKWLWSVGRVSLLSNGNFFKYIISAIDNKAVILLSSAVYALCNVH